MTPSSVPATAASAIAPSAIASSATGPAHVLSWSDVAPARWQRLIDEARALYHHPKRQQTAGQGKSLGLLFFNPSLRTRTSMEVAAARLGAQVSTLQPGSGTWAMSWAKDAVMDGTAVEHVEDAVAVLGQYYDALGVRLFASGTDLEADRTDARMQQIAQASPVPIINLESAWYHPCQALADAATITDHFDGAPVGRRVVLAWTYHPKALPMAVPNSALLAAARLGCDVTVARPASHALHASVMEDARQTAAQHGATVREVADLDAAMEGAEIVYAKSWGGLERYADPAKEAAQREVHRDWILSAERMARTDNGHFMHCLPVRRNVVVEDAVLDGPASLHLRQAGYRLSAQQALLHELWSA